MMELSHTFTRHFGLTWQKPFVLSVYVTLGVLVNVNP